MHAHRQWWGCLFGCENAFQSSDDLRGHLQTVHTESINAPQLDEVIQACERQSDMSQAAHCVLCGVKLASLKALNNHLGSHLEELALFALPPTIEDTSEGSSRDFITEGERSSTSDDPLFDKAF